MKNGAMEKLRELSKLIAELPSKEELEIEMGKIKGRLAELQAEIIKARARNMPEEKLKAEKETLTARLEELKEEVEVFGVKKALLEEEKKSVELQAKRELFDERWPVYERAIVDLVKKLREAEEAERKVYSLQERTDQEFHEAGGAWFMGVLPWIKKVLIKADVYAAGGGHAKARTQVDHVAEEAEQLGINLPEELRFDKEKGAKQPVIVEGR